MYIIEIVPLTKIPSQLPQIFSYFSAEPIPEGALVLASIGRRQEKAIVIETHRLQGHKIEIKSAGYEMKPIKKILTTEPILTANQIKLAIWLSQYYFASPGIFLKIMLPKKVSSYRLQVPSQNSQLKNLKPKTYKLILTPTVIQIEAIAKKYAINETTVIHSGLRSKQLSENLQKIASGEVKIIIGTRLAAFAPFSDLKEIIIEDETNSGHCSWDMFPHYRTHEIAKKLAEIFNAKLVFKSEPPSVESFFIRPIRPISPIGPMSEIIDLRTELREGNFSIFSRALQSATNQALNDKQQIILFLNRRGAGTFVSCRDCGYVANCQNCDAPLTYHLTKTKDGLKPILICHHCGQKQQPPSLCPKCQGHRIKAFGSGTQRVESEAQKLFKDAKILRLDSDTAQNQADQQKIIDVFKQKKTDILIGTQALLNHDLPKTAVVAIISADTLMHLPDFRSDERLFQTIWQLKDLVSPPFSKGGLGGILTLNFLIQTYNPQHKILQLAAEGNFEKFYEQEIATRQALKYPPFSQLIKLTYRHRDPKRAAETAKILAVKLTQQINSSKIYKDIIFDLLGPSPAFISKQKGKYVWQIILKTKPHWLASPESRRERDEGGLTPKDQRDELLKTRNQLLSSVPPGWEINIDPIDLL